MGEYKVKIFEEKDYKYHIRKPIKEKYISLEYVRLAKALKVLVDTEGTRVYGDTVKLGKSVSSEILPKHIKMITVIVPQINILLSNERFIDDETVTEQMYCSLLRNGYSRNIIIELLYAVFFSLNKTLKLSGIERKKLHGDDTFSYHQEETVNVDDNNIFRVKKRIQEDDSNAKVGMGIAILNGKVKKEFNGEYARQLLEEGLNHGSGKAAQVLGDDKFVHAMHTPFLNDYYSKAYEYYTIYGAISNNNPIGSHNRIIDILNLGHYHKKMLLNYLMTAVIFSLSVFVLYLLNLLNLNTPLDISIKGCVILTFFEIMTVAVGAVVRYFRPFFTQGWVVFLQFLIWFIALAAMIC